MSTLTFRLEARVTSDLHEMLKRAAEIEGCSVSDFVVSAVQMAAQKSIEQFEIIRLALEDQHCFADALLHPSQPAPVLKRAFTRRNKLLGVDEQRVVPLCMLNGCT
jgi:uncharacterized protein (DUF1778 family)